MNLDGSAPDAEGKDIIQYRCKRCGRIERVRLLTTPPKSRCGGPEGEGESIDSGVSWRVCLWQSKI
jgi:hypothetical protein